ncbi:MAG: hypothetical protein US74_C0044G0015 [Parcubacteria group bacterium GW2011_GWA2_38_13]|nr:MAG: hypothetical protein US74_C0044G0015 [Parcubacteria group bacterium GW2011_GWA2_38_13]
MKKILFIIVAIIVIIVVFISIAVSVILMQFENDNNFSETFDKTIICTPDQREADVCIQIYEPVCAKVNIQCIKAPCYPILETFSNSCEACKNSLVENAGGQPDPNCADKPYTTSVQVIEVGSPKSSPFAVAETNEEGNFQIMLPPGDYALQPIGGKPMPLCETQNVTIEPGVIKDVNLSCDSGIR